MLLVVTGSSGSGKTTLASMAALRFADLIFHDFDEIGVPVGADRRWRQESTELWIQRALEYQDHDIDLLLSGPSPLGEVLACPSAARLDGIAACLVDVGDRQRRERLQQRNGDLLSERALQNLLRWAAWHRGHAADPRHRPEVITQGGWEAMEWRRWTGWRSHDLRWRGRTLYTGNQSVTGSAADLADWIDRRRGNHRLGSLPLGSGWAEHRDGD